MARNILNTKRIQIDRSQSRVALIIAGASFLLVFSSVSSKSLLVKKAFQSRVNTEKSKTLEQLKLNNQNADKLLESYKLFVDPTAGDNIIGGNIKGTGLNDGDNARIVLDALPSQYDFPALASSLEKILGLNKGYRINGINAVDQFSSLTPDSTSTVEPIDNTTSSQPVVIPFQVDVTGGPDSIFSLIDNFNKSIRPIKITRISLNSTSEGLNAVIDAQTYYQQEKNVDIKSKVVK